MRLLRVQRVSDYFKELIGQTGLPPVRLHGLSHGAATVLLAPGVELKIVQEILGLFTLSIAPGHRENINFFGFIEVDIDAELAKLIGGWWPLRPTTVTESGTCFML